MNYHIAIYRDGVWEAIDEHTHNPGNGTYTGYAVVNPNGIHLTGAWLTFQEALERCQRLRRITGEK